MTRPRGLKAEFGNAKEDNIYGEKKKSFQVFGHRLQVLPRALLNLVCALMECKQESSKKSGTERRRVEVDNNGKSIRTACNGSRKRGKGEGREEVTGVSAES